MFIPAVALDMTINIPTLLTIAGVAIASLYRFIKVETKVDLMYAWWEDHLGTPIPPARKVRRQE